MSKLKSPTIRISLVVVSKASPRLRFQLTLTLQMVSLAVYKMCRQTSFYDYNVAQAKCTPNPVVQGQFYFLINCTFSVNTYTTVVISSSVTSI